MLCRAAWPLSGPLHWLLHQQGSSFRIGDSRKHAVGSLASHGVYACALPMNSSGADPLLWRAAGQMRSKKAYVHRERVDGRGGVNMAEGGWSCTRRWSTSANRPCCRPRLSLLHTASLHAGAGRMP